MIKIVVFALISTSWLFGMPSEVKIHLLPFYCVNYVEDAVYMESEDQCNEYVMEDFGYIWRGSSKCLEQCPWKFAQVYNGALFYIIGP